MGNFRKVSIIDFFIHETIRNGQVPLVLRYMTCGAIKYFEIKDIENPMSIIDFFDWLVRDEGSEIESYYVERGESYSTFKIYMDIPFNETIYQYELYVPNEYKAKIENALDNLHIPEIALSFHP